jgi:glycerol kinase
VPVVRPVVSETTALGAAYAAGLAVGFWSNKEELRNNWQVSKRWSPELGQQERDELYRHWQRAVERTFDWVED